VAELRFIEQHAGEEGTQGEGHAEQHGRAERHAQRDGQHGQGEQFARPGAGDAFQDPGNDPAPDHQHHGHEQPQLHEGPADLCQHAADRVGFLGGIGPEHAGHHRHHHQGDDAGKVFHDQPAHGDLAALGFQQATLFHRTQQHHRAGRGQREAKHDAVQCRPTHERRQAPAQQGGHGDLADRPGDGDGLHRHEVFEREMQADAEHQQHHAQFGQLVGQRLVSDETRGERANADACHQIPDQGRQTELVGQGAEDEGEPQADGHDVDQVGVMVHRHSLQAQGMP